jgi:hypothetical protein
LPNGKSHWDQFEQDLHHSGVTTMNLTSALKLQAAKDFPTRKYDYFIDDNHWNQFGIHVAAAAISKYLTNRHVPRALSLLAPPKGLQPAG